MSIGSLFSAFSLFMVIIYISIGIFVYRQNTNSLIHKYFLTLCASYSIWSFAYAFAYISKDIYVFSIWNKISAIGWCSFSAITLYLVLLLTDNKDVNKKSIKIIIFLPGFIFFFMALFLFGNGIKTPVIISRIFYIGDFLYNFSYLLASIIMILIWGVKSDSIRVKKQSRILVISSLIPFALNLLTQTLLPLVGVKGIPLMGQLYSIIVVLGVYMVIYRYKFLKLPNRYIFEEIADEMLDMVVILDEKGEITKITKHTAITLGYSDEELLMQKIDLITEDNYIGNIFTEKSWQEVIKINDANLLNKKGGKLPVNITCKPIFDSRIHDLVGVILIFQDIRIERILREKNLQLKEIAIRDSLTKLYNHNYSIELLENEINSPSKNELSVMMLDIDFFKRVNDNYGHQFGDYVLETIAVILKNNVAENGFVGRYGGEEFIIILPGSGIDKAVAIGEKIIREVNNYRFIQAEVVITMSAGVKQLSNETSVELIRKADELLYLAKQNGRNRIESIDSN